MDNSSSIGMHGTHGDVKVDETDLASDLASSNVVFSLAMVEDLVFYSPPLNRIYEQIRVPVVLRTSGCWFSDASGQGKSSAISYCAESLRSEFSQMPVFTLNLHMLPANASRSIPIRLLEMIDHKAVGGETTRIKIRLAKALAEKALRSPLRQVVLLFDEAQALRVQDLFLLKDLSNDLANRGVALLTIMFGESPKMETLVDKTHNGEDHGLAERFFVRKLDLCSYKKLNDWEVLMEKMDECRFPELDNKTVPEAFLVDVRNGTPHRMKMEAKDLWNAVNKMKSPSLRRIFTGVRWWMLHAGRHLSKAEEIPDRLWGDAMAYGACV